MTTGVNAMVIFGSTGEVHGESDKNTNQRREPCPYFFG